MPRKIAAGNWKMNGTRAALPELEAIAAAPAKCDVLICPPFPLLGDAVATAAGRIAIGAQDCHADAGGAHTGDTSVAMIQDMGASHVIVGHSERRTDHAETDAAVMAKAVAVLDAGLVPVICVGETLDQREAGDTLSVVAAQVAGSVPKDATVVIAYEPVWAIGTGLTPSVDQIAEVHDALRAQVEAMIPGGDIPLLYGGSVKASNAAEIFAVANVDGALVGGASLKAADFVPIVEALSQA